MEKKKFFRLPEEKLEKIEERKKRKNPSKNFRVFFFLIPDWLLLLEIPWNFVWIFMKKNFKILPAFFTDFLQEIRKISWSRFFKICLIFKIFKLGKYPEIHRKFTDHGFCFFFVWYLSKNSGNFVEFFSLKIF